MVIIHLFIFLVICKPNADLVIRTERSEDIRCVYHWLIRVFTPKNYFIIFF